MVPRSNVAPTREPALRQHRNDIDGLRAVAVLSVLAFHANTPGFSGGFVGVDVFFVISGYLICSIIVREIAQGSFSIARFYERRCKRILPALFAVLLFCAVTAVLILSPVEAKHLGNGIMATALSVSNIQFYLQGSYFMHGGTLNPLLMTWSLAVEEQFYIVFPLLMLLLYKRNRKHTFAALGVLCSCSFVLSVYTEFKHPEFNFYMPFTRAWELGAGTMFAVWQANKANRFQVSAKLQSVFGILGLLMIVGCVVFYSPATRFPGYEAILPVLGTVFLLASPDGVASSLLGLRPFTAVGLISYSLYLWHWPLLSFAAIVSPVPISPFATATLMLLAAILATLSYFFIETPFRTARYSSRTKVLVAYASLLAAFVTVGYVFKATSGLAQRTPVLASIETSLEMERAHDCIRGADRGPLLSDFCFPQANAGSTVALLGDSHAEAIAPMLRKMVNATGQQFIELTSYSCPPIRGFTRAQWDQPEFGKACAQFNDSTISLLSRRSDVKTVVLAGEWSLVEEDKFIPVGYAGNALNLTPRESGQNLVCGLIAQIDALQAQGKRIILIDDVPRIPFTPIDRVRTSELPVRRWFAQVVGVRDYPHSSAQTVPRPDAVTATGESVRKTLLSLPASHPSLQVIDAKELLCTATDCHYSDGANILYSDNGHVSNFGAKKILSAAHIGPSSP